MTRAYGTAPALGDGHTPEPWVVGNGGHSHGAEFELRGGDDDEIYITGFQWASPGDPEVGSMPSYSQARANVVLCAAAPDLLQSAKLLEGLCAWLLHAHGPDSPSGKEAQFRLAQVRAAIAKATGK